MARETTNPEVFLAITSDSITYHTTATEAVVACGFPRYNCLFQAKAASALKPGDELNLMSDASVIRLTGREIDYA